MQNKSVITKRIVTIVLGTLLSLAMFLGAYSRTNAEDAQPISASEAEYALSAVDGHIVIKTFSGIREEIKPMRIDGKEYLFLPSNVSFFRTTIDYDDSLGRLSLQGKRKDKSIRPGKAFNMGSYLSEKMEDGSQILELCFTDVYGASTTRDVYVLRSSQVASVFIHSDDPENQGRGYIESSKENKTTGQMVMLSPSGKVIYNGELNQIKARGNNTYMADKKPYQIKLDKKTDLLSSKSKDNRSKTWLLLSNPRDASMIRNSVAYGIAEKMGLDTPETRYVDLYYDGEYHGNYILSEKIGVETGRLDIYDLESANKKANKDVKLGELPTVNASNGYGNEIQYAYSASTEHGFQ